MLNKQEEKKESKKRQSKVNEGCVYDFRYVAKERCNVSDIIEVRNDK